MARKKHTLESAFQRLDEIIEQIRRGEGGLDKTVALYKEGIELSVFCGKSIEEAERQVRLLKKTDGGTFKLEDFEESGD